MSIRARPAWNRVAHPNVVLFDVRAGQSIDVAIKGVRKDVLKGPGFSRAVRSPNEPGP
jgi:hypothetical protein